MVLERSHFLLSTLALLGTALLPLNGVVHAQQTDSHCDYSDAARYSGWGWDADAGQSCPPVICDSVHQDADGDGFGVQENYTSVLDGQVCLITAESDPPPVHINRESGTAATLTRAFWDGNKDLAGKTIRCELYAFNEATDRYESAAPWFDDGYGRYNYAIMRFTHLPEVNGQGWVRIYGGTQTIDDSHPGMAPFQAPYWSVVNGVYRGTSVLESPYVESIENGRGQKGVRRWVQAGHYTGFASRWAASDPREDGYLTALTYLVLISSPLALLATNHHNQLSLPA